MFQGCVFLKLRREIILLTNFPLTVSLKTQNRGGSSDYIKKSTFLCSNKADVH